MTQHTSSGRSVLEVICRGRCLNAEALTLLLKYSSVNPTTNPDTRQLANWIRANDLLNDDAKRKIIGQLERVTKKSKLQNEIASILALSDGDFHSPIRRFVQSPNRILRGITHSDKLTSREKVRDGLNWPIRELEIQSSLL